MLHAISKALVLHAQTGCMNAVARTGDGVFVFVYLCVCECSEQILLSVYKQIYCIL